jgi:DNA repair protein RecO (recombination protein O)
MDDKTEGIVLQSVRYGDTSLIVKVFTRTQGLKSYMLKGAFNRGAKNRAALFQNLNVIQYVEVGNPKSHTLGYLKDAQLAMVYHSLPMVMNKSAIMMYVSELLSKTITEQEQNEALYDFIVSSLQWLDLVEQDVAEPGERGLARAVVGPDLALVVLPDRRDHQGRLVGGPVLVHLKSGNHGRGFVEPP